MNRRTLEARQEELRKRLVKAGIRIYWTRKRLGTTAVQLEGHRKRELFTAASLEKACEIGIELANNPMLKAAFREAATIFREIAENEAKEQR